MRWPVGINKRSWSGRQGRGHVRACSGGPLGIQLLLAIYAYGLCMDHARICISVAALRASELVHWQRNPTNHTPQVVVMCIDRTN